MGPLVDEANACIGESSSERIKATENKRSRNAVGRTLLRENDVILSITFSPYH
jgi:hypothetical protein